VPPESSLNKKQMKQILLSLELLKIEIANTIGTQVLYCRSGGGAGSILLLKLSNGNRIMAWRYWEIYKNNNLLCTAEDDTTAVYGIISQTAPLLENKIVENISFDLYHISIFLSDNYNLKIYSVKDVYDDLPNWNYSIPDKNIVYEITSNLEIECKPWKTGD
jgi:hypothetical protein